MRLGLAAVAELQYFFLCVGQLRPVEFSNESSTADKLRNPVLGVVSWPIEARCRHDPITDAASELTL